MVVKSAYERGTLSEFEEQALLIEWCERSKGRFPELRLLFAIPNGGARPTKISAKGVRYSPEAQRLKQTGVKRGVPDLFLPVVKVLPSGELCPGVFIEMKTLIGVVAPEQRAWIVDLNAQGYLAVVCKGWLAAVKVLETYLCLPGK